MRAAGHRPADAVALPSPAWVRWAAGFAIAAWLFVALLAASPNLHETLHHHDASSPSQHCVATLLSQGQVAFDCPTVAIPLPIARVAHTPPETAPTCFPVDRRLSPGRAPPALSA